MRLVSFGEPGRERPGVVVGDRIADIRAVRPQWPGDWIGLMEAGRVMGADGLPSADLRSAVEEALARVSGTGSPATGAGGTPPGAVPLENTRLGPPIPRPSKIIAIGLNYRDHAREQGKEPPAAPLLFAKAPTCLVGARDDIVLPDPGCESRVDTEAELCLVMGRRGRNLDLESAPDHILGWTIMNDVSGRESQYGDKQWFRGKSFDTFGPCGPWIVTREELPDPGELALEADWDDSSMQRGNTRDLIFPPAALVSYVSRMMTLLPGDLITTGTPAGVGVFRDPPLFVRRGTEVVVRLERIGEIRNRVV